jgi:hypothetical protein
MVYAKSEREPARAQFFLVAFSTIGICLSLMSRFAARYGYTAKLVGDVKQALAC